METIILTKSCAIDTAGGKKNMFDFKRYAVFIVGFRKYIVYHV